MKDVTSATTLFAAPERVGFAAHERGGTFRAYFFGPFRVFRGEEVLGQRGQRREKALLLLKWFLLNPGRPGSMEQLVDLGWPDTLPEKGVSSFHVAMHCLRRMLEPELRPGQESSFIRRSGANFYRFEARGTWWSDTDEVERHFEQARAGDIRGDAHRACFYYSRVTAHAARRFLEDEEPQGRLLAPYTRRYEGLHAQALIRLIEIHGANGELDEALEYAYRLLRLDPYNELAAATIIESHLLLGRPAHARRQLRDFLDSLERGLGAGAGPKLRALQDQIMHSVPCCDNPTRSPSVPGAAIDRASA